jgi:hypothetical protein
VGIWKWCHSLRFQGPKDNRDKKYWVSQNRLQDMNESTNTRKQEVCLTRVREASWLDHSTQYTTQRILRRTETLIFLFIYSNLSLTMINLLLQSFITIKVIVCMYILIQCDMIFLTWLVNDQSHSSSNVYKLPQGAFSCIHSHKPFYK